MPEYGRSFIKDAISLVETYEAVRLSDTKKARDTAAHEVLVYALRIGGEPALMYVMNVAIYASRTGNAPLLESSIRVDNMLRAPA